MAEDLVIMAVGDLCIVDGGHYPTVAVRVREEGGDLSAWLEKVAPTLRKGDFTIGNLEGPVCDPLPPIEGKAGTFGEIVRMQPAVADVLKQAGFHAMALANNHTMDFGSEGLLQTIANLKRVGIAGPGGGRNVEEARKLAVLEKGGVRLGLLSYSSVFVPGTYPAGKDKPGIATVAINTSYEIPGNILYAPGAPPRIITTAKREDREKMEQEVRTAKAQADVVIVNWHWGLTKYANSRASGLPIEDSLFYVLNYQEDMGRVAIDAGADLVIGHHPHRLQGMELYRGKLICYSVCDLTLSFNERLNLGEETVIVKGRIDRKTRQLTRVSLIPMLNPTKTAVPYIVPVNEAGRIISELQRVSKKYSTRFEAEGEEISVKV